MYKLGSVVNVNNKGFGHIKPDDHREKRRFYYHVTNVFSRSKLCINNKVKFKVKQMTNGQHCAYEIFKTAETLKVSW